LDNITDGLPLSRFVVMNARLKRSGHSSVARWGHSWAVVVAVVAMTAGTACSVGTLPEERGAGPDAGEPGEDVRTMEDTGPEADTQTPPKPWDKHDKSAFTFCGASGVSSGEGIQAIQCYGPVEISGESPEGSTGGGETVTWQPGATRVVTP
jgi:hypothetical protein